MSRVLRTPHVTLTPDERRILRDLVQRRKTPRGLATRAQIILLSADEPYLPLTKIGRQVGVCRHTVRAWRHRFVQHRREGLGDAPKSGAPRTITDADVERVIRLTLESLPDNATQWSTRSMAAASGMTQSAVSRIWRAFGLRPHLTESFKLSQDPLFIEKVRDIVGLYLSPPERALVLCVDEKPQIQALERNGHVFRMQPGIVERRAHDYVRHGTTTLFAALDAKVGRVIGQCYPRHRSWEFKAFLDVVDANVPKDLAVHVILDNYITHKTKVVQNWLLDHPRFRLHFTPTSASWLNLVECWFSILTTRRLRRGSFTSRDSLEQAIQDFITSTNEDPKPFLWTKTADEILTSVARFCTRQLALAPVEADKRNTTGKLTT